MNRPRKDTVTKQVHNHRYRVQILLENSNFIFSIQLLYNVDKTCESTFSAQKFHMCFFYCGSQIRISLYFVQLL